MKPRNRKRPVWIVILLLVAVCLDRSASSSLAAPAGDQHNVAGIVVEYAEGHYSMALVPFEEETISGIDLLSRSGLSLLMIDFGGMGKGVCAIEKTGCELDACRARLCQTGDPESPFWHYLQHPLDGDWHMAALGASSSKVSDGGVDGWFWTGSNPEPAAMSVEDIAAEVGFDLDQFRSTGSADLAPVSVTIGGADDDPASRQEIVTGVVLMAAVVLLGGYAVRRSRKSAPT